MKVRVISAGELTRDLRGHWIAIQRGRACLSSPYFSPAFVEAADACRDGVRIGVMEEAGRPIGFFPFEAARFGVGGPVGGRMSDFQGVIVMADVPWRPEELMSGCGLRMWRFDHLLCAQAEFAPFFEATAGSPAVDLSRGFADYCLGRRRAGSKRIERLLHRSKKLQVEQGELRFELDSRDPQALEQVLVWKREQCRRTGVVDFLAESENSGLIRRIHDTRTADFAGVLSVLRVGGRIAAAHFGMRSHDTLHWWFPGFEQQLGHYSPGGILLVELIRGAAAAGLAVVDLGKGDDEYKRSFCTHETAVAEGAVVVSASLAALRRWNAGWIRFLRTAPVAAPLLAPIRALRRRLRPRDAGLSDAPRADQGNHPSGSCRRST